MHHLEDYPRQHSWYETWPSPDILINPVLFMNVLTFSLLINVACLLSGVMSGVGVRLMSQFDRPALLLSCARVVWCAMVLSELC